MAGKVLTIDSVSAITASTTKSVSGTGGVYRSAQFFLDVTTASGGTSTWTVSLQYLFPSGQSSVIASITAHDSESAGPVEITRRGEWATDGDAVPMPNQIVYTEDSGTDSLTASVIAFVAS